MSSLVNSSKGKQTWLEVDIRSTASSCVEADGHWFESHKRTSIGNGSVLYLALSNDLTNIDR